MQVVQYSMYVCRYILHSSNRTNRTNRFIFIYVLLFVRLFIQLEQSTQSRSFGVLIGSRDPEEVKKEKIDKLNATIEDVRYLLMFSTSF